MTRSVLGIGIMSVPERHPRLAELLKTLDLPASVVSIDERHKGHVANWWAAADIACSAGATHALIIEDDAEPCPDFLAVVKKLIERYPNRTIGFFSRSPSVLDAPVGSLLRVHDVPTDLAVVYPVKWLRELKKDFSKVQDSFTGHKRRRSYGADEMRLELRPNKRVWTTVPSLVEHGCPTQSTLAYFYPDNVARRFIGKDISALSIDWSRA